MPKSLPAFSLAYHGISQSVLGREAGQGQAYVSKQLGGTAPVTPELSAALHRLLPEHATEILAQLPRSEVLA